MRTSSINLFLAALIALGANMANAGDNVRTKTPSPVPQASELPSDTELNKLGMRKLAEMTAMSRHDEICPDVPDEWSAAFIMLLTKNPPSEEEVEAQERNTLALRKRVGQAKWCELYSTEMQETYLALQLLMQHK
jgi:hypothetical protein